MKPFQDWPAARAMCQFVADAVPVPRSRNTGPVFAVDAWTFRPLRSSFSPMSWALAPVATFVAEDAVSFGDSTANMKPSLQHAPCKLDKMEASQPDVYVYRLGRVEAKAEILDRDKADKDDLHQIAKEVAGLRRTVMAFMATVAGSALLVSFTVLATHIH